MINLNFCGGLTMAGHQVSTKLFYHSAPLQHREREEKIRWKNLWVEINRTETNAGETALMLCEHCSEAAKTLGSYQTL